MTLPRVLLADDHTLVLEGFRRLLDEQCELVGTVGDGRALLEAVPQLKPDIVILDISMPVLNGIDAARVLKIKYPHVKVVFITMHAGSGLCPGGVRGRCFGLFAQALRGRRIGAGYAGRAKR